jgi:DNA-binding NtrC family response regulator
MPVERQPSPEPPTLRVLIGDADLAWCDHVGRVVGAAAGFAPVVAASGEQALGLVGRGAVDAAILGVRLERSDGLTVLRLIRTIDAGLPCVLVSRQTGRRLLQDALSLAAFSVVRSPVDDRVLADVANRLLERFLRRFGPT